MHCRESRSNLSNERISSYKTLKSLPKAIIIINDDSPKETNLFAGCDLAMCVYVCVVFH